jgi:hypothetical protein
MWLGNLQGKSPIVVKNPDHRSGLSSVLSGGKPEKAEHVWGLTPPLL